jgi:hypothetical protein
LIGNRDAPLPRCRPVSRIKPVNHALVQEHGIGLCLESSYLIELSPGKDKYEAESM